MTTNTTTTIDSERNRHVVGRSDGGGDIGAEENILITSDPNQFNQN
jgi:hypothetical protein